MNIVTIDRAGKSGELEEYRYRHYETLLRHLHHLRTLGYRARVVTWREVWP